MKFDERAVYTLGMVAYTFQSRLVRNAEWLASEQGRTTVTMQDILDALDVTFDSKFDVSVIPKTHEFQ